MFLFQSSQDKKIRQDVEKQFQVCLRTFQQKNQDKYKKAMETISKYIQKNNQKAIEMVVDSVKSTIKSDQHQPAEKYQSIKLLRDLMKIQMKNKNKSLGKYVVKKILKRLTILAAHKANSNDEERGRDIFQNVKKSQEKYSILFLNQLLLCIQQWAKTWPGTSDGTKKQFNQAYKDLITNGVQFPKQVVKAPPPQTYRGEDANRNSLSPYNSLPKRESQSMKRQQKSPLKSQIAQKKIQKGPKTKKVQGLINQKQLNDHFQNVVGTVSLIVEMLNQSTQISGQMLDLIRSLIHELSQIIAKGNQFVAVTPEQEWKENQDIVKILQTFEFDKAINKDIKKAQKNPSQFQPFKNKYVKMGKLLLDSLSKRKKQQKPPTKPKLTVQVKNNHPSDQTKQVLQSSQMNTAKRLSIPKVRQQNRYNSSSGPQNNWVIKQRSQYNSNSHKDQHEQHEKFGSFGVGGIGQKLKNQSSKQKSAFAQQSRTQRQQKQQQKNENEFPKTQQNIPPSQDNLPPKVLKNVAKIVQTDKNKKNVSKAEPQFNAFQLSSQNKQNKHQEMYFDQPYQNKRQNRHVKETHQKTKDMFNDSDFKEQIKVQKQKSQKSQDQSGNFFGDFGGKVQKQQLPTGNRNPRRQKTAGTNKQIDLRGENPFQNNMNSNIEDSANNFSAFNKDKSSVQVSKNQVPSLFDGSTLRNEQKPYQQESYQNPFDKSLDLNKSSHSGNANFWQSANNNASKRNKVQNPFMDDSNILNRRGNDNQDDKSDNRSKKSINPFQNDEVMRKSAKSINPFDDDNKSQLSKKDRSFVKNFSMNQSFTKSQKSNPFQTTNENLARKRNKTQNPLQQKQQFKPQMMNQFQSVSQRASFKKIANRQTNNADLSVDNPFNTSIVHNSQIQQKNNRDSLKFSVKSQDKNQGFDFDQFQNIGQQRYSVQTSHFPPRRQTATSGQLSKQNPFETGSTPFDNKNSFDNNNSLEKKISFEKPRESLNNKQINFSQFGDQNQSFHQNQGNKRQPTQKSINFQDFQNIAKKSDSGINFSAFQNSQQKKKKQNKNQFSAFQVSKTQQSDFFRQTQKQQKIDKVQDNKSRHSGFSAFNMNVDSKSQQKNKSGVNWNQFDDFNQQPKTSVDVDRKQIMQEFNIRTDRTQQGHGQSKGQFIDKNSLKLNFSQNTSKYHSPQFMVKYDSANLTQQKQRGLLTSERENMRNIQQSQSQSIKLQQFAPLQKKGYEWNPTGVPRQQQVSRLYNISDYDLQKKKKQVQYYKQKYLEQKSMLQQIKQIYHRERKKYIEKIQKINQIINQKQSYKKILVSLKQSNHNKQQQIFLLNQKIRQIQSVKQKILQKQKALFQKTKQFMRQQQENKGKVRTNNNKWEIFNRNMKMMRQRQQEPYSKYASVVNHTNNNKGYNYSRA